MTEFVLALRLAVRELRSGLSGFRIFFTCLFLGVASIAAVGSLSDAFLQGLAEQGRVLLGGDIAIELVHRSLTPDERTFVSARGKTSDTAALRAMAYAGQGGTAAGRTLVELKAVDGAYPLYGTAGLSPAIPLSTALGCDKKGVCGSVAEQALLDRLNIGRHDLVRIGDQVFRISAVLTDEPDRLSGGFSLGPHVIISQMALHRTGLVVPGSLISYTTHVKLNPDITAAAFRRAADAHFPDSGWQIRDRDNPTPGTSRFIRQAGMFLTLAALTILAVAGVGAGQSVSAFLDRKRDEIATLKAIGAEGGTIFLIFFLQVMMIAGMASVAGAALGAAIPFLVERSANLPLPIAFKIHLRNLTLAFLFGTLSAAAFSLPALSRTHEMTPASLFRDIVSSARHRSHWLYLAGGLGAGVILICLSVAVSPSPVFSAWFLAGTAGVVALFRLTSEIFRFVLTRLPRPRFVAIRMAIAGLTRPGASAGTVIVALGIGLTLLATVTLLEGTISREVDANLPITAPSFYFVDVQPGQASSFDKTIAGFRSARNYQRTPMIRGRIVALNGVPVARATIAASARWAVNGDRGLTYAASLPADADIVQGQRWSANYRGPPLVSFDAELAEGMGLKVGSSLTLNVLGRELETRIANLRRVDFSSGRQNFIIILSPGLIDQAPHSFLATVSVARDDEERLYRAITDAFPTVTTV
ncbi:MAG TPA: FtsX-like permease family protein, partial [Rhizomicrobium sp.]